MNSLSLVLFLNENSGKGVFTYPLKKVQFRLTASSECGRRMEKGRLAGCQRVICGKIVAIQNYFMISSTQPTRGSRRIAILAMAFVLLLVLIGVLDRTWSVQAELTDNVVSYEECQRPLVEMGERDVVRKECLAQGLDRISQPRARYPHCGIDESLTRTACEKRLRTEALRREVEEKKRALTPVEEQQVIEHIKKQYLGDKVSARRLELQDFLSSVRNRLSNLLTTQSYSFTDNEMRQLDNGWWPL